MDKLIFALLPWCIPLFFIALSVFFFKAVHGHGFLGLVCLCLAGVISCYYILSYLPEPFSVILTNILTGILTVGFIIYTVTLGIILWASRGDPTADCDFIIVLGAKVNGEAPSRTLAERIKTAHKYLISHPHAIAVLSGGQGPDEGIAEAECMRRELIKLGISENRLLLETQSTTTWENLRFSLAVIKGKTGQLPERIGLLSSDSHLFRACLFAKKCGVTAAGIPAKSHRFSIWLNYLMREGAGIWHYIILGGQYHD